MSAPAPPPLVVLARRRRRTKWRRCRGTHVSGKLLLLLLLPLVGSEAGG